MTRPTADAAEAVAAVVAVVSEVAVVKAEVGDEAEVEAKVVVAAVTGGIPQLTFHACHAK